ncbi:MAG: hypothetical protein CMJ81_00425 [Planctomycetaceae bacterium]|nr:hypothetical protein [Planctomycetaceae bacterium]
MRAIAGWVDWEELLRCEFSDFSLGLVLNASHASSVFCCSARRPTDKCTYSRGRERNTTLGRPELVGFHGWTKQSLPVCVVSLLANLLIALFSWMRPSVQARFAGFCR